MNKYGNKKCLKCLEVKPLDMFHSSNVNKDGYRNYCKKCRNKEQQKYVIKNQVVRREKCKEYWKNNKAKMSEYKKEYYKKNKEKISQRHKVYKQTNAAIRKGKLIKSPCLYCNNKNTEKHHADYTKPLLVVWLCSKHHRQLHKNCLGEFSGLE